MVLLVAAKETVINKTFSKLCVKEHWMILCSLRENGSHKDTTEKECRMYCAVNGGRAPTAGDQAGTSHI